MIIIFKIKKDKKINDLNKPKKHTTFRRKAFFSSITLHYYYTEIFLENQSNAI